MIGKRLSADDDRMTVVDDAGCQPTARASFLPPPVVETVVGTGECWVRDCDIRYYNDERMMDEFLTPDRLFVNDFRMS